jgi:dTDP-glucose pyrophosphorylase
MKKFHRHLIRMGSSVREVLDRFEDLGPDAIVLLVDEHNTLLGALTDGDIRRGLIKGYDVSSPLSDFAQPNPVFLRKDDFSIDDLRKWRDKNYRILPLVDENMRVVNVINLRKQFSYLPLHVVIMAGGRGERLRPLTDTVPKPLLMVGPKPILEHNIDRLAKFGVNRVTISIKYLGQQIQTYFGNGVAKEMDIDYVSEETPLGTAGAIRRIKEISEDIVLIMNSDLLTTIDFEEMYYRLISTEADMIVASIPYEVKIPYGIIETKGDQIIGLHEKPTYTYFSNAGIYMVRKSFLKLIPEDSFYNATDLMTALYSAGHKVVHYSILGYWLDIGKHEDFQRAQQDILQLKL